MNIINVYMKKNNLSPNELATFHLFRTLTCFLKYNLTLNFTQCDSIDTSSNPICTINCSHEQKPDEYHFNIINKSYYHPYIKYNIGPLGLFWQHFSYTIIDIYSNLLNQNIDDKKELSLLIYLKIFTKYEQDHYQPLNNIYDTLYTLRKLLYHTKDFDKAHNILSNIIDISLLSLINDYIKLLPIKQHFITLYPSPHNGLYYDDTLDEINTDLLTKYLDMFDPFENIKAIVLLKNKENVKFYLKDGRCQIAKDLKDAHDIYFNINKQETIVFKFNTPHISQNDETSKLLCMFQNKLFSK